jgi:hypothetical protein
MWSTLFRRKDNTPPVHRSPRSRSGRGRLNIEVLESRTLLSYTYTVIADTSPTSPYSGFSVDPQISTDGQVAYEAELRAGRRGIFRDDGTTIVTPLLTSPSDSTPATHPAHQLSTPGALAPIDALFQSQGWEETRDSLHLSWQV